MTMAITMRDTWREVQNQLLPPPYWVRKIERLIELIPRLAFIPDLIPLADVKPLDPLFNRWLSLGSSPTFDLQFANDQIPKGWVYLEAALQRSMGNRSARLFFDRGSGFNEQDAAYISSNLRGSIRELISIPRDTIAIRWVPCGARGFFSQTKLIFHQISATEKSIRMLERVFTYRHMTGEQYLSCMLQPGKLESLYEKVCSRRRIKLESDYGHFIDCKAQQSTSAISSRREEIQKWIQKPVVHIWLTGEFGSQINLDITLDSVRSQIYPFWCVHAAGKNFDHINKCNEFTDLNSWGLVLHLGDKLAPESLYYIARTFLNNSNSKVIYSDHDFFDVQGQRHSPAFKPDWNAELYYTHNYLSRLCAISYSACMEHGVLPDQLVRPEVECQLILKIATPSDGAAITHIAEVLYHRNVALARPAPFRGEPAEREVLTSFLAGSGIHVLAGPLPSTCRVEWPLPKAPPLVSIIVPTRDQLQFLQPCLQGVLERTDYPSIEVLVMDNQSSDPQTLDYLQSLSHDVRVRVIPYNKPFNYSAINNYAVTHAQGSVLVFLNNDVEVIHPGWLSDMVRHALRLEVGAVGAKLLYSDGTVQHGGVILGLGGVAGHAHRFVQGDALGYCGRLVLAQSLSAVTAACLVIRKAAFLEVGGFNSSDLQIAFNDVDLCLKLKKSGFRNIYEPSSVLYHHESVSRGFDDTEEKRKIFKYEADYMLRVWGPILASDEAYNPNLSINTEDFSIAQP